MSGLRIGPAGWSYPQWKGVVYPAAGPHPLETLARQFDVVEINSSFYQPLKPEIVQLWLNKIQRNRRFRFTAKMFQRFTHARILEDREVEQFKEGLRPLLRAGRLGALLMQFPWAFRFTAENRDFFIRLRREFHEFPLVAEMRHSSWMAEEAIGTFLDYRVGFCNIDQPESIRAMPPTAFLTSGIGYARLHGRGPGYLYSQAELAEWAGRIEKTGRYADEMFVIFSNDASAKSIVNALQLQAMMAGVRAPAPIELRRRYPLELECFGARRAEQQSLFTAA
ncbi:MAG TPA: DUF72 domain-containing protein [Bryobacteraceae bacterium]|jgi:uncharacterized protein YecE (DUF72 family)|nr:DUF72 domain-containing protein [Bryobacteraceae bacterium]